MKHFVPAGSSRTLNCSSEKFIVDFALEIGVARHAWNTQQSKSFYENMRNQLVTQYQDAQGSLENVFTTYSPTVISWLTALITRLEPGYLATQLVREKLLQLEQTPVFKGESVFDRHSMLGKLRAQLTFKLEQLENRLQSIDLIEYGRRHYEQVFALWNHGHYFPFSPAGRCYIVLQELCWGAFGEAMQLADDVKKMSLIEEVRSRVIDKLAREVRVSSNTRHYYHEWLATPTTPGILEYKQGLAWLGDTSHVDKQPVSYSVTQTWSGISLGMPRICSAMRLGGALVDELLAHRFNG